MNQRARDQAAFVMGLAGMGMMADGNRNSKGQGQQRPPKGGGSTQQNSQLQRPTIHTSGVGRAPDTSTPNSIYAQLHPKTGRAIQNTIYDSNGLKIGHVDFKNHGGNPSGHWHFFSEPGNPASGHTGEHRPHSTIPSGWDALPQGILPQTPICQ